MAAQNATNAAMISLLHKLTNISTSPKYSIKILIFLIVYFTFCSFVSFKVTHQQKKLPSDLLYAIL